LCRHPCSNHADSPCGDFARFGATTQVVVKKSRPELPLDGWSSPCPKTWRSEPLGKICQ
jgi:hypothetical protein